MRPVVRAVMGPDLNEGLRWKAHPKRPGRRPELRRRLFQRGVDRRVGRVERCAEAIHSRDDGERNTRSAQGVFNRGGA
jgi:hypothetical protein